MLKSVVKPNNNNNNIIHGTRISRVASPTLGRLYPLGNPGYSFYRRLSGPQNQSGHGVKENLHLSDTRDQTWAVHPVVKQLVS